MKSSASELGLKQFSFTINVVLRPLLILTFRHLDIRLVQYNTCPTLVFPNRRDREREREREREQDGIS